MISLAMNSFRGFLFGRRWATKKGVRNTLYAMLYKKAFHPFVAGTRLLIALTTEKIGLLRL